jgi:hypothetical protein
VVRVSAVVHVAGSYIVSRPDIPNGIFWEVFLSHRDKFSNSFFFSTGFYSPYRTLAFLNGFLDPILEQYLQINYCHIPIHLSFTHVRLFDSVDMGKHR